MDQKVWYWISKSKMSITIIMLMILILILGFTSSTSASTSDGYISHSALEADQLPEPQFFAGRTLLQAEKPCPINFENQTYTIITSKCKGPRYPADQCCAAFEEFACPFADQLNDLSNVCAKTMFSYINLYGGYPAGLFANECKGSKRGLECSAVASGASTLALQYCRPLRWLLAAVAFLLFCRVL